MVVAGAFGDHTDRRLEAMKKAGKALALHCFVEQAHRLRFSKRATT